MTTVHNKALIRAAGTAPGRLLIVAAAGAALWPAYETASVLVAIVSWFVAVSPSRRPEGFSILAVGLFLAQILPQSAGAGLGVKPLAFAAAWVGAVLLWSRRPMLGRRAFLLVNLGAYGLLGGLVMLTAKGQHIGSAIAIHQLALVLLWRTGYWIRWRMKGGKGQPAWRHLYALAPFIGAGGVPIGKSPEYFAKYEAKDEHEVSLALIEGLRLLVLALAWRAVLGVWGLVYSDAATGWMLELQSNVPTMASLIAGADAFEVWQRWVGLFAELVRTILELAAFGHTVVGICCLIGFRIPRNTQAPLLANGILEFWNRYYFYFKELLLDFFFFPAYIRLKGLPVAWRAVAATFAAAFLGNLYYHLYVYGSMLIQGDVRQFLDWTGARAIYCLLLAAGLSAGMVRSLRGGKPRPSRRLAGMAVAIIFFGLIHVWNGGQGDVTIAQRWHLLAALFGLG